MPAPEVRRRAGAELRIAEGGDSRILEGIAVRYGDWATIPGGLAETVRAGAFGDLADTDAILNVQHDRGRPLARTGGGGLELIDGPDALAIRAVLPATREAEDALELVRAGVLRGLSIEFRATKDRLAGTTRTIERAALVGIAVVDRPAYPGATVATRAALPLRLPWWLL